MNKFLSLFLILLVLFELSFVVYGQTTGICCFFDNSLTNNDNPTQNENCGNANEVGNVGCTDSRTIPTSCSGSDRESACDNLGDADWNYLDQGGCSICGSGNLCCTESFRCRCGDITNGCFSSAQGSTVAFGTIEGASCERCFGGITDHGVVGDFYVKSEEGATACCAGDPYDSDEKVCCNTANRATPVILDFDGESIDAANRIWDESLECCYSDDGGLNDQIEIWDAGTGAHGLTCQKGGADPGDGFMPGDAVDEGTVDSVCPPRTEPGNIGNLESIDHCYARSTLPCYSTGSNDEAYLWNIAKEYTVHYKDGTSATAEYISNRFGYKQCSSTECRDLLYDPDNCSGCGNQCETGAAPDGNPNAGESQVKDYCDVGLCPCETGCSTSTGYHIKRYARCSQQQFADEYLSWTSAPGGEKETGGSMTEQFGSDPWPPQPGAPRTWFPYEDGLNGKTHDSVQPYGIWFDYGDGHDIMSASVWNDFADDWWGHCPVDFLKSPYHCIAVDDPSGTPIYDGVGATDEPDNYFAYNLDQDIALARACETDCRGNIPMLPCLRKCNRFNQNFRKVVAKARADDFADSSEWQKQLEELCSACDPTNTDIVPNDRIVHNYCCEHSIECALYTVACQINGQKLVQSWAGDVSANQADLKFSATPCDDRSPVLPGVYRDKFNRCEEPENDRFKPVDKSFGLGYTHIPIKVSPASDTRNIGVIVSRDDELRPYGAGFAGESYRKTFDFECTEDVGSFTLGGFTCPTNSPGKSCSSPTTCCGLGTNTCYRWCDYNGKRTCYQGEDRQDWNTEMTHLIFDPEVSDPEVDSSSTYRVTISSNEWAIIVSDYSTCRDDPGLVFTDYTDVSFGHTDGHAYVITALFVGDDTDPNHDRTAKVLVTRV